ncbi:hypothetical protein AVEN_202373-1 [Araneus ventricosus]|uniref:Uncharacterized protein n=1 Tax=Araneus ventricosus TaxID=182803 RepID=A0A4Y2R8M6_ARAVE|nr:hypothetical protein AVEN_202373-1 [Araneus ventricosus]
MSSYKPKLDPLFVGVEWKFGEWRDNSFVLVIGQHSKLRDYYTFPENHNIVGIEESNILKILDEPTFNHSGIFENEICLLWKISIMLSTHQIYKENTDVTTSKNVKTNANAKPKGLGLKNSTNICHNQKLNSDSLLHPKKNSNTLKKNVLKQELKSSTKGEKTSALENSEEWPEMENMYIYNDSDDDYEDILPKSQRVTKAEIDASFITCHIHRRATTDDKLPTLTLETMEDFNEIRHFPIIESDLWYDDSPLELVPLPDISF